VISYRRTFVSTRRPRSNFRVTASGEAYFLEINPIPQFTGMIKTAARMEGEELPFVLDAIIDSKRVRLSSERLPIGIASLATRASPGRVARPAASAYTNARTGTGVGAVHEHIVDGDEEPYRGENAPSRAVGISSGEDEKCSAGPITYANRSVYVRESSARTIAASSTRHALVTPVRS
jgi:hypothetical protein